MRIVSITLVLGMILSIAVAAPEKKEAKKPDAPAEKPAAQKVEKKTVKGSGKSATENRDIKVFQRLELDIDADVALSPGEKLKCTVKADDNVLPLIATNSWGTILRISAKEPYSTKRRPVIKIEAPAPKGILINSSGDVRAKELTTDTLMLTINGSGKIEADGKVRQLMGVMNGSGKMLVGDLEAQDGIVTVNGSGDIKVHATGTLRASVNGSGSINFVGEPEKVFKSVRGSGKVGPGKAKKK